MCPGYEDLRAGGSSSVLQTPTTPCKHTVSVRRPVLSRSNPGRKDAGGGRGIIHPIISPAISAPLSSHGHSHPFAPFHPYSQSGAVHPSPNHLSIPLSICRLCFSGQIRAPKSVHPCVLRGAPTHPPAGTRRDLLRQAQCCNPDNLYPLNKASRFSLPCH